ncbi:MAG: helix-turn-helix transcriptional regulator [Candidatus Omnitrophica bacterium]|nr:helix-turn-helix transcriptional regulator [Candidatus Omnitrophota bacterium]
MKIALRIKEVAKERGFTLSAVAKMLGVARSNMSSIAKGTRGVSLKALIKISNILECSIDELIVTRKRPTVFKNKKLETLLRDAETNNYDGMDKTWVDNVALAHRAHYRTAKKT